ncbi:MAG: heme-binding domain-containing protein [Phycisphaerales bacterium]|nr:heme-binding domain-containing protein [Phycisphaerales bacterium]
MTEPKPDDAAVVSTSSPQKPRKRVLRWVLGILAFVFLAIQFVPVERANPAVTGDLDAPAEVKAILKRACYDCHSNETVWPWYSKVAPVSWLVASDVHEGREQLNFSTWASAGAEQKAHRAHEAWEEVEEGEMPLWFYTPLHPDAKLSDADKQALKDWSAAFPSDREHRGEDRD